MRSTVLIVPGLYDSGPAHWQTWIEEQLPDARRVEQLDWDWPVLAHWAGAVRFQIDRARGSVWLIAHSFGCLSAVVAAGDRRDRIAGAMLVAPADPDRFAPDGLRGSADGGGEESIAPLIPAGQLGFPSIVVASVNDPWVSLTKAAYWADRWGSRFVNLGSAGHINTEAAFGPWPEGLTLFNALRQAQHHVPLGSIDSAERRQGRRDGALALLRQHTRSRFDY